MPRTAVPRQAYSIIYFIEFAFRNVISVLIFVSIIISDLRCMFK